MCGNGIFLFPSIFNVCRKYILNIDGVTLYIYRQTPIYIIFNAGILYVKCYHYKTNVFNHFQNPFKPILYQHNYAYIYIKVYITYINIILVIFSFNFQVAWIHIDRQMILTIHRHVISRIPRYSITYDNANTWLLHVSQAQQDDRGYYMCQVNTNPMISQVGYLQVVGRVSD